MSKVKVAERLGPLAPRRGPGTQAKKVGKPLKGGSALRVMTYPRRGLKAVLVEAARKDNRKLSNFLLMGGLDRAATVLKQPIHQLIPAAELVELQRLQR